VVLSVVVRSLADEDALALVTTWSGDGGDDTNVGMMGVGTPFSAGEKDRRFGDVEAVVVDDRVELAAVDDDDDVVVVVVVVVVGDNVDEDVVVVVAVVVVVVVVVVVDDDDDDDDNDDDDDDDDVLDIITELSDDGVEIW